MATADALAHLTTDFYVQLAWNHILENKTYEEFVDWVQHKLECDFHDKIFFDEVRRRRSPGKVSGSKADIQLSQTIPAFSKAAYETHRRYGTKI